MLLLLFCPQRSDEKERTEEVCKKKKSEYKEKQRKSERPKGLVTRLLELKKKKKGTAVI